MMIARYGMRLTKVSALDRYEGRSTVPILSERKVSSPTVGKRIKKNEIGELRNRITVQSRLDTSPTCNPLYQGARGGMFKKYHKNAAEHKMVGERPRI